VDLSTTIWIKTVHLEDKKSFSTQRICTPMLN